MTSGSGIKTGTAILWAVLLFVVSAIVEATITIWMFKKWGGCPIRDKERKL